MDLDPDPTPDRILVFSSDDDKKIFFQVFLLITVLFEATFIIIKDKKS